MTQDDSNNMANASVNADTLGEQVQSEQTKREKAQQQVIAVVKRIALIAGKCQAVLSYVLVVGLLATSYLVWCSYSSESELWWNIVKGALLSLPVLILGFAWTILGGLSEMPDAVGKLNQDTRTAFSGMKEVKVREPKGLRGMFSVLNNFRKEDSLAPVLDTVGGITLMLNPFFIFVIFVALVVEFLLALSAFLIVLF